jgi:hypothetical protein
MEVRRMRKILATIGAALAIGVLGVLVGASVSGPEQQTITASPNWIPLAEPAGGPSFFPLEHSAGYYS